MFNDNKKEENNSLLIECQNIVYQFFPLKPDDVLIDDSSKIKEESINSGKEKYTKSLNEEAIHQHKESPDEKLSDSFIKKISSYNTFVSSDCLKILFLWISTFSVYFGVLLFLESTI